MASPYADWMTKKTKGWTITGGFGANIGAGVKGGVKIWHFKNLDQNRTRPFLYIESGAGLTVGAKVDNLLETIVAWTNRTTDAIGGNPASIKGLDKLRIKSAFSFVDIIGSVGGTFSAGVAAGAAVEMKAFRVTSAYGPLFEIDMPAAEIKAAAEVNVMSLLAGSFVAFHKDFFAANSKAYKQEKQDRVVKTRPSQNWNFGSKV